MAIFYGIAQLNLLLSTLYFLHSFMKKKHLFVNNLIKNNIMSHFILSFMVIICMPDPG